MKFIFVLLLSMLAFSESIAVELNVEKQKQLADGAFLYQQFCTLCHGRNGMGMGALPAVIKDYPETNLLRLDTTKTPQQIAAVISEGNADSKHSMFMPPWDGVLVDEEIDALANFIFFLREDTDSALAVLGQQNKNFEPNARHGQLLFLTYCKSCHGPSGRGDGRLAAHIKDPPPSNLVESKASEAEMREIIIKGGAAVGRSPRMPIWASELDENDLSSVINYIQSLRKMSTVDKESGA